MTIFGLGGWPNGFYGSRKVEVPSCKTIRITMPWAMREPRSVRCQNCIEERFQKDEV